MKYILLFSLLCTATDIWSEGKPRRGRSYELRGLGDNRTGFKCPVCSKVFSRKANRGRYVRTVHKDNKQHKCKSRSCKYRTGDISDLRRHVRGQHSGAICSYYSRKNPKGCRARPKTEKILKVEVVATALVHMSSPKSENNTADSTSTSVLNLTPVTQSPLVFHSPLSSASSGAVVASLTEWPVDNCQVKKEQ